MTVHDPADVLSNETLSPQARERIKGKLRVTPSL